MKIPFLSSLRKRRAESQRELETTANTIGRIVRAFPVGSRFLYVGRSVFVTGYAIGPFSFILRGEYSDLHGVIHERVFNFQTMRSLLDQREEQIENESNKNNDTDETD